MSWRVRDAFRSSREKMGIYLVEIVLYWSLRTFLEGLVLMYMSLRLSLCCGYVIQIQIICNIIFAFK